MTKKQIERKIVEAFSGWSDRSPIDYVYWASPRVVVVQLHHRDFKISFDMLAVLSEALATKLIDIEHEAGWAGSDVTPGDPATVKIWITLTSDA